VIETTGVAAIGIHGRTMKERSTTPCHYDITREISRKASVPIIANGGSGDVATYEDIARFKSRTECTSVMLARCAQWNPSIFRKEGPLSLDEVIKDYVRLAVDCENNTSNTKYCVAQMLQSAMEGAPGKALLAAANMREICEVWGLVPYLESVLEKRERIAESLPLQLQKELGVATFNLMTSSAKRRRAGPDVEVTEEGVTEMLVTYDRREFPIDKTPKTSLYVYSRRHHGSAPHYKTVERSRDRQFKSVVTVGDRTYSSSLWAKSKRNAEQSAATVALLVLGKELPYKAPQTPTNTPK
jgi:tRNA-dihydrouridine synthase 2